MRCDATFGEDLAECFVSLSQNRRMEGAGADDLRPGLYDTVLSRALADQISGLEIRRLRAQLADLEAAELPDRIAEIVAGWTRGVVAAESPTDRHEKARSTR